MLRCSNAGSTISLLLAAALLAGCGGGDRPAPDEGAELPVEEPAQPEAAPSGGGSPPQAPSDAPLTVADIDRWEKGIAGEMEAVRAAGQKLAAAQTSEDTLSAMMGVQEMATVEAGAEAAGVDLEHYRRIRSNLSAAASYLTPELGGIDTTMLSPEQRAEMRQMNEAQLTRLQGTVPADVLEALRPRAAELRKRELELVGARLKGAGM